MTTVYLTENAYRDIVLETAAHPRVETGGILLGGSVGEDWFVVEVLDPGPRTSRSGASFEYNHTYASHLAGAVARRYHDNWPRLVGLWHRHPGSLDVFSSVDDETHREYLRLLQGAFISMLVNIDPEYRMTFYRVQSGFRGPRYARAQFVIGDEHFPTAFLKRKDAHEIALSLRRTPVLREPVISHAPETMTPALQDQAQSQAIDEVMSRDYQRQPPPVRSAPARQEQPGPMTRLANAVGNFISPREEDSSEPARSAPQYRPYDGEEQESEPTRRASAEQRNLLDMMDAEFDYLDSNGIFQYHVSPQEPGFRLEVKLLMTPTRPPYPSRIEFLFYYRGNVPVVAIEGREQPYQPGVVRDFYQRYDVPPAAALPPAHRPSEKFLTSHPIERQPPEQEQRHDGPAPPNRPRP
jgi:hypothetical protein